MSAGERRVLAARLSRMLEREAMTLDEIEVRLGEVPRQRISQELNRLVNQLIVCAKRDERGVQVFEAWSRVIARMERSRVPAPSVRSRGRGARRIA